MRPYVVLLVGLLASCSDDIDRESDRCTSYCFRDCPGMLAEMRPDERTAIWIVLTSTDAVSKVRAEISARDPAAEFWECNVWDLCVGTNRDAIEYVCTSEDVDNAHEEGMFAPH